MQNRDFFNICNTITRVHYFKKSGIILFGDDAIGFQQIDKSMYLDMKGGECYVMVGCNTVVWANLVKFCAAEWYSSSGAHRSYYTLAIIAWVVKYTFGRQLHEDEWLLICVLYIAQEEGISMRDEYGSCHYTTTALQQGLMVLKCNMDSAAAAQWMIFYYIFMAIGNVSSSMIQP